MHKPLQGGAVAYVSWLHACMQDAAARKQRLKRFGHAVGEQAGDSVTVRGTEDIPFERVQKTRQTTEEKRAEKEDLKSALQGSDKSAVVGRCAMCYLPDIRPL